MNVLLFYVVQQVTVTTSLHPVSAIEVGLPGSVGAVTLARWIDMKDDPGNLAPIGAVALGIEQAQIGDEMCAVIVGQNLIAGRAVGHIWIERWRLNRPLLCRIGAPEDPRR